MAEQTSLLDSDRLTLPDDLSLLEAWIDETAEEPTVWRHGVVWTHAWVLRDLLAALPPDRRGEHEHLMPIGDLPRPTDARKLRALIKAVRAELEARAAVEVSSER